MSKLLVEVDEFVEAAWSMRHEVAENVQLCLFGIAARLEPGLVGVDPAGAAWAADYDTAVRSVLAATAQLANAGYRTSQLFAASGHNYDSAEAASTTSGVGVSSHGVSSHGVLSHEWTELLADPPTVRAPVVASAGGAGADTPADWWLVEHTIGYLWPAGHQDQLHATAEHWRSAARGIDLAAPAPMGIVGTFIADHIAEADDINRVCGTLYDRITALADNYRALADACDQYATHLDTCHTAIRDELRDLVIESAALQTSGALLSVFSLGAAEIPTQAAQTARIALAAGRIERLIDRLITTARTLATSISRITGIADHIHDTLTTLTTTRIAYAGITQVPTLHRIDRAAMAAKDANAAVTAGDAATGIARLSDLPGALQGRKIGDPGVWGDERTLMDHATRHSHRVGATSPEDYVRRASDFLQQGLQRGVRYKRDEHGTIRMWDAQTGLFGVFRSDGSTRSFFKTFDKRYFERQPGEEP